VIRKAIDKPAQNRSAREEALVAISQAVSAGHMRMSVVRLPRIGGELFVSAHSNSPKVSGLQADLNAAANIGLKPLLDPDWAGAWWFVPASLTSGKPIAEKVAGSSAWQDDRVIIDVAQDIPASRNRGSKKSKAFVNAWNPLHHSDLDEKQAWQTTKQYWAQVEDAVARRLMADQMATVAPQ
jgi:hypothetical protein